MKERPILFSAPMVRALLDGTKTQTRRAMRVQPGDETTVTVEHFNQTVIDRHGDEQPGPEIFGAWWDDGESGLRCPYGAPGDRLWVREAFSGEHDYDNGHAGVPWPPSAWFTTDPIWYWADGNPEHGDWTKPRPSIHMPRWASRINLEVTDVRAERLWDIRDADVQAEGCQGTKLTYAKLWESINGKGSWDANPWCWAVSFKVLPIAGPSTKSDPK
jgi:hypothetical protein